MVRAIDDFPSFFTPRQEFPLIIDCGANIGVSLLEWKTRWPMAKVICFEPDPDAFRLLQMNVHRNDIPSVRCIEAAVGGHDGTATLYGEIGRDSDSRGNSLRPEWGQRRGSQTVDVRCERLSPFIEKENVAFLKLDIEGAEESVIDEIGPYLSNVEAMYIEVHENDLLDDTNSLPRIVSKLRQVGMTVVEETRYQPHALPAKWDAWGHRYNARQTQLMCYRD